MTSNFKDTKLGAAIAMLKKSGRLFVNTVAIKTLTSFQSTMNYIIIS